MGIAKSRLVDELTIQQVVKSASTAWDDTEADTLKLVAKLLDANERIRFYLPAHRDLESIDTKTEEIRSYESKTKVWVQGGVGAVTTRLRRMARDDLGWDALDVIVFAEAPHTDERTNKTSLRRDLWRAPFKDLKIPTKDINRLFEANDLPVPDWAADDQHELEDADDQPRSEQYNEGERQQNEPRYPDGADKPVMTLRDVAPATETSEAVPESADVGAAHDSRSHADITKIRIRLKSWIEDTAKTKDPEKYTKENFRADARKKLDKNISESMFRKVWREAKVPKGFKQRGRRPGRQK